MHELFSIRTNATGIYGVLPHLLPNQAHIIGLSIFAPPEWSRRWRWPKGLDGIQKGFVSLRRLAQLQLFLVTERSRLLTVSHRTPSFDFGRRVV